jgi:hypothetical protein
MSALPDIDLSALPADQRDAVAALIRENSALKTETADLQQVVKRLEYLVAELNHVVHGKKSEKLDADDRQLAFEDLETAVAGGRGAAGPADHGAMLEAHDVRFFQAFPESPRTKTETRLTRILCSLPRQGGATQGRRAGRRRVTAGQPSSQVTSASPIQGKPSRSAS